MSKLQIQEQYKDKIASAETMFEKQMIEEGIDAKAQRDASQYQCVGCGS